MPTKVHEACRGANFFARLAMFNVVDLAIVHVSTSVAGNISLNVLLLRRKLVLELQIEETVLWLS